MNVPGMYERWTMGNCVGTLVRQAGSWLDLAPYKACEGRVIPHPTKRRIAAAHAHRYGCATFVETGTYHGDMVAAGARMFAQVFSIELSEYYYRRANHRFAGVSNVSLHFGDSAELLPKVIEKLSRPSLFSLDAYYSDGVTARAASDTPIVEELAVILRPSTPNHVELIDDAHRFDDSAGYPTLPELQSLIAAKALGYACEIATDIIRVTLKGRS